MIYRSALLFMMVFMAFPAYAGITGKARVIDGDTIQISSERIRLSGIDAPEINQTCTQGNREWACGREALAALYMAVRNRWVTCKGKERDKHGRLIAACYVNTHDLNARMVREGWALAYKQYSTDYVEDETIARNNRSGVWRGKFTPPWNWRQR